MENQPTKDLFVMVLELFYTISHWLGEKIVSSIQVLFPNAIALNQLIDPIGILAISTIILLLAQVARKIAWIVVSVGWGLIILRIIMVLI